MPAFARFSSHVQLSAAFGALLFPGSLPRLLLLGFRFLGGSQSQGSRFVGLLHRALRMNAAQRIGSFTTNGTKISNRLRNDFDWLDVAHVAPNR
jgi:hypothetical protein